MTTFPRGPSLIDADRADAAGDRGLLAILIAAGLGLALAYAIASARIPLQRYFPGAGVTLDFTKMLGAEDWRVAAWSYFGLVAAAFALYGVALAAAWRLRGAIPAWVLFGVPALAALALIPMYPPTAVDMFHYHASARVLWIHEHNPLITAPGEFPYPIGYSWSGQPSPYGPLWSLLGAAITIPAQDHFTAALYGYKILAAASLLGCAYLVWRTVRQLWPDEAGLAVVAFAWNPFIALRVVGNGHNDLVMMAFVLLSLWMLQRRHWNWAMLALALSILVKFVTLLLVPLFALYVWQHAGSTTRERLLRTAQAGLVALAAILWTFLPFWEGLATFDTVRAEADKMITSTALALGVWRTGYPEDPDLNHAILQALRLAFVALAIPVWWQSRRDLPHLIAASFTVLLLYLLLAAGWFRPWYLLWPLAFAALRPRSWLLPLLLAITFFGSFADLVEQYRQHWSISAGYTRAILAPVILVFLPSAIVWLAALTRTGRWSLDVVRPGEAPARD